MSRSRHRRRRRKAAPTQPAAAGEQDQARICIDCLNPFEFTVSESAFFRRLGYEFPPNRCARCRKLHRAWMFAMADGHDEQSIVP